MKTSNSLDGFVVEAEDLRLQLPDTILPLEEVEEVALSSYW